MAKSIVISSGHGLKVRGASSDMLDEVDEARRVVNALAPALRERGVNVTTFHDDVSTSQNENLNRIVDFHNSKTRDLDISVHFNAYEQVDTPRGCEVLYVTQSSLAAKVSAAIASVGFIDRGAKKETDLFFLNGTDGPAILIEVCFVDSIADVELYEAEFDNIIEALADVLGGEDEDTDLPDRPAAPTEPEYLLRVKGKVSHFGGPDDDGVAYNEGLAFLSSHMDAPQLFLPYQPSGTTGLARRLNPYVHYVACRWDYNKTPKTMLAGEDVALVRSVRDPTRALTAFPADWGPNENTGRVADVSPKLMLDLGLTTDDEVEVLYPYEE
jgi:N-acetylmuramoyl-L-alanine amidase-like protein